MNEHSVTVVTYQKKTYFFSGGMGLNKKEFIHSFDKCLWSPTTSQTLFQMLGTKQTEVPTCMGLHSSKMPADNEQVRNSQNR